jgi:hypothetical protein
MRFQNRDGNGKYLYRWDKENFAPRIGFAYRLFGGNNTVIRGGYGMVYGLIWTATSGQGGGNFGFDLSYNQSNPPFRLRDGIPANALVPVPGSELSPSFGFIGTRFARSGIIYTDPDVQTPYSQHLNLTLQHQLKDLLVEVGYLGNLGRHVTGREEEMNTIRPEMLARTDLPIRQRRPFQVYTGDVTSVMSKTPNNGIANYNAFTAKVERRFRNGYGWIVSYTLSKWISNTVSTSATGQSTWSNFTFPQNVYNRSGERALENNHIPHRLVVAPIVDLPFGKGRKWLNRGGVANAVLGGWQISTMGTLQSGSPISVQILNGGRDLLDDALGFVGLRPHLLRDANAANQGEPAAGIRGIQWLDPGAFALPARYTHGSVARTLPGVLSPGFVNFDMMLAKNFEFGERFRAQFRWETFDTFNTPIWGSPPRDLGAGSFGVSVPTTGRRIMQLGLKVNW